MGKKLYTIRLGPGAAILPKEVVGLRLEFATKINDGHFGARKVWRNYLPRLKYHNPAVSITVSRSTDQQGPANLTVFYASPSAATITSSSPSDASHESARGGTRILNHPTHDRTEIIDMKHRHESDILSDLMDLTNAAPVTATADEELELQQLKAEEKKIEADRIRGAALSEKLRQEKALLDQARGAIGSAR